METSVAAALQEIAAALAVVSPQLEGLRDFQRLNLKADARREIEASLAEYARREQLLVSARTALEGLVSDGYPAIAVRAIEAVAYADLVENAATIAAALAQFSGGEPVTDLGISAGAVERKR
jgi:hypothetical protein